mmetsp:Transcript_9365/g.24185  ORF Transcript_9365/g.24185 Transcript_9365/m.24185 type:complete len:257 (+) Transcript_9365:692-1462(+)
MVHGDGPAEVRTRRAGRLGRVLRRRPSHRGHHRRWPGTHLVCGHRGVPAHALRARGRRQVGQFLPGRSAGCHSVARRHRLPLGRGERPARGHLPRPHRRGEACAVLALGPARGHGVGGHHRARLGRGLRLLPAGAEGPREGAEPLLLLARCQPHPHRVPEGWHGEGVADRDRRVHPDLADGQQCREHGLLLPGRPHNPHRLGEPQRPHPGRRDRCLRPDPDRARGLGEGGGLLAGRRAGGLGLLRRHGPYLERCHW